MDGTAKSKPWKQMTSAEKRARRAYLKAEREAQRRAKEERWSATVAAHFSYLETEYGFRLAMADASQWWETYALYTSPLLAVKVARSVEFDCAELWLIRLVDGRIPEYPIFINPDTPINYVMLDRIVAERAPREAAKFHTLRGLSDEQIERTLVFLAASLRAYGDDALRGDFAIFDVIAEQLHQDAREHPQEIKVWLPDTTQSAEEQALVEKVRKDNPQQPVSVGRYRTGASSKRGKGHKTPSSPVDDQSPKPS